LVTVVAQELGGKGNIMHSAGRVFRSLIAGISIVLVGCNTSSGPNAPSRGAGGVAGWKGDWRQFAEELTTRLQKKDATLKNADEMLEGRDIEVEWCGVVSNRLKSINLPGNDVNRVEIDMEPLSFKLSGTTSVSISRLGILPEDEEWDSWANVKSGQRVVFRTRFHQSDGLLTIATDPVVINFTSGKTFHLSMGKSRKLPKGTQAGVLLTRGGRMVRLSTD